MTYGYEDICKKPFRKISERTVEHFVDMCVTSLVRQQKYSEETSETLDSSFNPEP